MHIKSVAPIVFGILLASSLAAAQHREVSDVDAPQPRRVRKVCYVADMSSTVSGHAGELAHELRKAIDVHPPIVSFNIVLFGNGEVRAAFKRLEMGMPDNKRAAYKFIEEIASTGGVGEGNPAAAVEQALKYKPELIYLTTARWNADAVPNVVVWLDEHNGEVRARINTVALFEHGDYEKSLREIAQRTDGTFKFIASEDLKDKGTANASAATKPTTAPTTAPASP